MKHLHLLFVGLVLVSFVWRVYLAEKQPEKLAEKWIKILPHALAAGLLLSGATLVLQGNWADNYGWIVAKVILLVGFIGLGIVTLRQQGSKRWAALAGALYCFAYIVHLAIAKQVTFF